MRDWIHVVNRPGSETDTIERTWQQVQGVLVRFFELGESHTELQPEEVFVLLDTLAILECFLSTNTALLVCRHGSVK